MVLYRIFTLQGSVQHRRSNLLRINIKQFEFHVWFGMIEARCQSMKEELTWFWVSGNSSQVSDGAGAVLLMMRRVALEKNLPILGVFRCEKCHLKFGYLYVCWMLVQFTIQKPRISKDRQRKLSWYCLVQKVHGRFLTIHRTSSHISKGWCIV